MTTLGFEEYVEPLKVYLAKYREMEGEKTNVAGGNESGAGGLQSPVMMGAHSGGVQYQNHQQHYSTSGGGGTGGGNVNNNNNSNNQGHVYGGGAYHQMGMGGGMGSGASGRQR